MDEEHSKNESNEVETSDDNTVKSQEESIKEIQKEQPKIEYKPINDPNEWFKALKWLENPFILNILPDLFVGYKTQSEDLIRLVREDHKLVSIVGPTRSDKSTILKWLSESLNGKYAFLYI